MGVKTPIFIVYAKYLRIASLKNLFPAIIPLQDKNS